MNKFEISKNSPKTVSDTSNPVLYKIFFGDKGFYYLHKSKELQPGYEKFLEDVFRGIRDKGFPKTYANVVDFCKKYPALYKVSVEIVLNAEPTAILKAEADLYESMKDDPFSLNNLKEGQFKPEWMLRHQFKEKCIECIKSMPYGVITISFNFCPICGRSIKE